ncbi:MAG: DUF4328 domain-containing protein [Verrucomicrobiota bacterium]
MQPSPDIDPYQPPACADPVAPALRVGGFLKDPRFIGTAALVAVSLQIIVKLVVTFGVLTRDWVSALTIAHLVVFLASGILYLVWIYRVAANVERIHRHADVKPGWVVGCYFIPVVNWVAPAVTLRNLIRLTFVHRPPGALPAITIVWWISFMACNLITVLRVGRDPVLLGIWTLCLVVSWGCLIVLITRISRAQADFPAPQEPPRVRMTPLSASRRPGLPPVTLRPVAPDPPASLTTPDPESDWGGG